jgi:outer membrane protease
MNFSWASREGYYQYATNSDKWDASLPATPIIGPAINYTQYWLLLYPGVALDILLNPQWSVGMSLNAGPGIWAWAYDSHISRRIDFEDFPSGGILLEPRGEISFFPNKRFAVSAHVSYRYIRGAQGLSNYRFTSGSDTAFKKTNDAGAGFTALDTGLSLKMFF